MDEDGKRCCGAQSVLSTKVETLFSSHGWRENDSAAGSLGHQFGQLRNRSSLAFVLPCWLCCIDCYVNSSVDRKYQHARELFMQVLELEPNHSKAGQTCLVQASMMTGSAMLEALWLLGDILKTSKDYTGPARRGSC